MVDGSTTAHSEVWWIYSQGVHSDLIRAPVHTLCFPRHLGFVTGIAVEPCEIRNILLHRHARWIWHVCTLGGRGFLWNDSTVKIRGSDMAHRDNAGGIKDRLREDFAVQWQRIVGWKPLQCQYCTSLEGQDKIVSPPYFQDWYTSHCYLSI